MKCIYTTIKSTFYEFTSRLLTLLFSKHFLQLETIDYVCVVI